MAVGRARVRALIGASVAALAIAGCTANGTGGAVNATGTTLTLYLSQPPGADAAQMDVVDAAKLAFRQQQNVVTSYKLRLGVLTAPKLSENARTAIQDKSAIAYVGELPPGASDGTVGITNAQDLLQVSPTDTALELTRASPVISGSPNDYYESLSSYGKTFARVVPSGAEEASAQVTEMQALGVKSVFVEDDGSDYGKAIAHAVMVDAKGASISVASSASGADAIFYGGQSVAAASKALTSVAAPTKLFLPSALDSPSLAGSLSAADGRLYVSAPGFMPRALNAAARKFVADFKSAYGHAPDMQAIFGFEAMSAVLSVLKEAGNAANQRGTVIHDFRTIKNRSSVLGTYSINSTGDTNLAQFVFLRLHAGALVPLRSVSASG